jgi:hypothetical protein
LYARTGISQQEAAMFITDLLRKLPNEMLCRIRPRRRAGRRHDLRGSASRAYSTRALAVESLEDRAMLTTYLVDTLADNPAAVQGDMDELVSLREAVTAASMNAPFGDAAAGEGGGVVDEITFDASLAGRTIILGGEELAITDRLSLIGLGAADLTISGNHASRVFSIAEGVDADIEEVTIADGAGSIGAGIWNAGNLKLTSSTITGNVSPGNGGGIANRLAATLTIDGCTFLGNTGRSGGAIDNYGDPYDPQVTATVHISDSSFSQNHAGTGGVIWSNGPVKISGSTLSGNSANSWGGAIFMWSPSTVVEIKDSTLSGNFAGREGGAIDNNFGTLNITNTTISGNSTNRIGGAIYNWGGSLKITNGTLTANRADADGNGSGDGGALYDDGGATYVLHNTIVAGNLLGAAGSDSPNEFSATLDPASSHNLIGDAATAGGLTHGVGGNIVGNAGSGTIDITTVLDPNLADNGGPTLTLALVPGGLAVNAGDNNNAVDTDGLPLEHDQRGEDFVRIYEGTVDIGAFEVQPQSVLIDVKPGSEDNPINLGSKGVIAVAIFTTDDFDASQVDASTVVFAGASAAHSGLEDVDGDGDLDMVLHFQVQDTNLADVYAQLLAEDPGSSHQSLAVSLSGKTTDDTAFEGTDGVDLFFSGKALRELLEELAMAGLL